MKDESSADKSDEFERWARLLKLGLSPSEQRPVDRLVERLGEEDARAWFDNTLETWENPFDAELLRGKIPLAQLRSEKERVKELLRKNSIIEVELVGLTKYFLLLASALAHHGVKISGLPNEEVAAHLTELASVVPGEWRDVLVEAIQKLNE